MAFAIIFDSVGVGEWFVLLAVVLIVVGPKRLPSAARKFGMYYSRFRRAAEGFRRQLLDMDTEFTSAVREVKSELDGAVNDIKAAADDFTKTIEDGDRTTQES